MKWKVEELTLKALLVLLKKEAFCNREAEDLIKEIEDFIKFTKEHAAR